jgi:DNA-binding XRE family transcriptional regulator
VRELREHKRMLMKLESFAMAAVRFNDSRYRRLSVCQLSQFERGSGRCRRCHNSLGLTYIEIILSNPLARLNSRRPIAMRIKVGGIIRRLRSRRGITQAELASLTGIHRTYLSHAERGQVEPSISALIRIVSALGVDKILLRVSSSST